MSESVSAATPPAAPVGEDQEPPATPSDAPEAVTEPAEPEQTSQPPEVGPNGPSLYPDRPPMHMGDNNLSSGQHQGEKVVKKNKVYIGGLPEDTRQEDLQNCFGTIGNIMQIELKVGYGFVEFDTRAAAEEAVEKYHEGHFLGQKIRVELSRGGGKTAQTTGDPGACFKCGNTGHWARECSIPDLPGFVPKHRGPRNGSRSGGGGAALLDRISSSGPPPRDSRMSGPSGPAFRDDYGPPPQGNSRYGYDAGPPRDYYPPPPGNYGRAPSGDYGRPPPGDGYGRPSYMDGPPGGYSSRGRSPGPPPMPPYYDRYDRGPPPMPPMGGDRYSRGRDDYRDYPPPGDYRGRPMSPPRYGDYPPPRFMNGDSGPRYRGRSQSPSRFPPRHAPSFNGPPPMNNSPYPPRGNRDYASRGGSRDDSGGFRR